VRNAFIIKVAILVFVLTVVTAVVINSSTGTTGGNDKGAAKTFFTQFVIDGGPIVWFILLPMSIITISLAIEHIFSIRRSKLLPGGIKTDIISLIRQFGYHQLPARISENSDFISIAVAKAIQQEAQHSQTGNLVAESLQEQAFGLLRRIEWANIIGNVAPMIGLFGTVFGMIKAFNSIVIAGGQPQPAQLAEGISIALVTTFWGLLIAIPALSFYGILRNRIETLVSEAAIQAEAVVTEIARNAVNKPKPEKQKQPDHKLPIKSFS